MGCGTVRITDGRLQQRHDTLEPCDAEVVMMDDCEGSTAASRIWCKGISCTPPCMTTATITQPAFRSKAQHPSAPTVDPNYGHQQPSQRLLQRRPCFSRGRLAPGHCRSHVLAKRSRPAPLYRLQPTLRHNLLDPSICTHQPPAGTTEP